MFFCCTYKKKKLKKFFIRLNWLLLLLLIEIVVMKYFHKAHGYFVELEMNQLGVGYFAVDLHESDGLR